MNQTEQAWNKRSKNYGDQIEGVLFKSFPKSLNNYLDKWMFNQVKNLVNTRTKIKILDLGCGYGRLSQPILKLRSNISTVGVDIASEYVNLYNKNLKPRGKAYQSDISKLPFKDASFDRVFMVTTLMYKTNLSDQSQSIRELFRILKHSGQFVIIERNPIGHNWITLKGLADILKKTSPKDIESVGFTKSEMENLVLSWGGKINKVEGMALFTLLLPGLLILSKISMRLVNCSLPVINLFDNAFCNLTWSSLYISYYGEKTSSSK